MGNNKIRRNLKKKTVAQRLEVVDVRLDDHAAAITMSAQAHKHASDFLIKLLDVLELEVKKNEDGTIDILRKSGIVIAKV